MMADGGERQVDLGSWEYARDLFDRQREYIDAVEDKILDKIEAQGKELVAKIETHNAHRREGIEAWAATVAIHEAELSRGSEKPGWVHLRFLDLEASQQATAETMKWMNRLLISSLIGLAASLIVLVLRF